MGYVFNRTAWDSKVWFCSRGIFAFTNYPYALLGLTQKHNKRKEFNVSSRQYYCHIYSGKYALEILYREAVKEKLGL